MQKTASKLSHSSCSDVDEIDNFQINVEKSQLWEKLEEKGLKNQDDFSSSDTNEEVEITMEKFLDKSE